MTVFYTNLYDGTRRIDVVRYLGDIICPCDISWWIVPGTIEDDENETA